jgi:hypothetical protein
VRLRRVNVIAMSELALEARGISKAFVAGKGPATVAPAAPRLIR